MRNIAYLRVSTADQDTEKFKADVLRFANDRRFGTVDFMEEHVSGRKPWRERKLGSLLEGLRKGDRLIFPELTRAGRSTIEVLEVIKVAKERGIDVFSVKENLTLNGDDLQTKVMVTLFALFAELERDFISLRTKEALRARVAEGVKLGRPRGPGKSKLDAFREEILALIRTGSRKSYIAKKYGTSEVNLHLWLKKRGLQQIKEEY